jgi:hypothetical protein
MQQAPARLVLGKGNSRGNGMAEDDKGVGEGGAQNGEAAAPGAPAKGDTLEDAADEAVREIERRKDGGGHAGAGDIG